MPPSIMSCAPVALAFFSLVSAATVDRRASTCNGHSELCDRSFGNVTFVGAHDSYAVGTNNLAVNQDYNITQQLNDGIRMLQMQVHNLTGTIELCHSSCALYDGGSLETYLTTVKSWMDNNTNDVVSLLIVNSDGFSASDFGSVFESVGLANMSYSPSSSNLTYSEWPTLSTLIDAGTRLVTFMDTGADFSTVTYIIDEFTNVWETAYDVTDTTFDCNVNRTKGDSSSQMYLINHFLDKTLLGEFIPDVDDAATTNAANGTGSLGAQVDTCVSDYGRNPNFMLVDFYEYGGGSVFEVAATANGVTYDPTTPIATPVSSSTSSSSTDSTSGAVGKLSTEGLFGPAAALFVSLMAGLAILG